MLGNFGTRVPKNMRENLPEGISFYQALIVASIVEREAAIDSERSVIASVYYNRLRGNPPLRLQADPTVQYALGQDGGWWPELLPADLAKVSPYNTYTRQRAAARPDLQPEPEVDPGGAESRPDRLSLLRRQG